MTTSLPRPPAAPTSLESLAAHLGGQCHGSATLTGVCSDNRIARPGDLFAGVPGAHVHGATFAAAAFEQGAVALLTDSQGLTLAPSAPAIVVDDVAHALGPAAAFLYGNPASTLRTFAVTGTNGKTTTAFMVEHILNALGACTGLIGTVEMRMAGQTIPSILTTPMPADLQGLLAFLVERGGSDLVMEASSHALAQGRTDPIRFSVAGFTNLTQDHLDFHDTMDEYFEAKASLFTPAKANHAVVSVDDEWGVALYEKAIASMGEANVRALAVAGELDGRAGWQVRDVRSEIDGSRFCLESSEGTSFELSTRLPGSFNVANAALAAAMTLSGGVDAAALAELGDISPQVPGRMEVVSTRPRVVVDFAHNTDALIKAMAALRVTSEGRLITLTGAAGERDQGKRPAMGEAVARYSDEVIITDDDPHEEDPAAIRADVLAGARPIGIPVREIADRREAIHTAIMEAADEDTVFLAGRGHETLQWVAGGAVELDDRVEARAALDRRNVARRRTMKEQ